MILRSPAEDENGGISLHHIGIGISFPLDGERQDTGVRERDKSHQLPLSFPSRGRNSAPSPVALFISQPMSRVPTHFEGAYEGHDGLKCHRFQLRALCDLPR